MILKRNLKETPNGKGNACLNNDIRKVARKGGNRSGRMPRYTVFFHIWFPGDLENDFIPCPNGECEAGIPLKRARNKDDDPQKQPDTNSQTKGAQKWNE